MRTRAGRLALFLLTGASCAPCVLLAGKVEHGLIHHSVTGLFGGADHVIVPRQLLVGAYSFPFGCDDGPHLERKEVGMGMVVVVVGGANAS